MTERIYLDNDHVVKLDGLKDKDGVAVTSATVECRILDSDKQEVSGITWPLALSHVSDGNYEVVLDKAVDLTLNSLHFLEVTAVQGGTEAMWRERIIAAERSA